MPETVTVGDLVEYDYNELLQSIVASTYGLVSGQPSGVVAFDNTAATASHDPRTETAVITEQNVPEALRSQRLLKLVLLQGAAAHEAGHHKTFALEGETHNTTALGGFVAENEDTVWPNGGTMPKKWRPLVRDIRRAVWMETEDLRANAFIEREYTRLYWDSLRLLIRYTRIGWIEMLLAGLDFAVQTAKENPKNEMLWAIGGSAPAPSIRDLIRAQKILRGRGLPAGLDTVEGLISFSNVWRLIPETFKVLYVYWPREIDRFRDPIVDITAPLQEYYDEVVANFPAAIRCFFPDDAGKLLKAIESIRTQAESNIKSASTPARAADAYRIATGRFFADIVNLECAQTEPGTGGAEKKVEEPGDSPSPTPSPEAGGGTPSGGNATRDSGNRAEKKLRDKARQQGDDAAEEEARERGDPSARGASPIQKIRDWLSGHPSDPARTEIEKDLETYIGARKK